MARRAFAQEQITNKLWESEVHLSQGYTVGVASSKIGVTGQTYYRWRREYGS
jgi:putative transposase